LLINFLLIFCSLPWRRVLVGGLVPVCSLIIFCQLLFFGTKTIQLIINLHQP
jgi:hypothetical protein